jgi:hypothetical protein
MSAGDTKPIFRLGSWTMTLLVAPDDTTEFARPRRFQVTAPGGLLLDIHVRPGPCSVRGTPEERAAMCWGEQFSQVPSAKGLTFEVDLFGLYNKLNWSPCETGQANSRHREFAAYNLLSIEADHIVYNQFEKTLAANGDVLIEDETGEHRAESVSFRLEDGKAIPIHSDH